MFVLKLALKNALRHKLRTFLTVLGIAIAVTSFGFMRTIVTAWSAGVTASAENRMIVRHAVSFIFPLPYANLPRLQAIPGVNKVSYASWFGGVYKDPNDWRNFFPRFAVDPDTYLDLFPEFIISPEEVEAFKKERSACIVGAKIAREHGFKIGDVIPIEGDIYLGQWQFVVRGIYQGRDETTDATQLLFHWKYLDERLRQDQPGLEGNVGWYVLSVASPTDMPRVARAVDELYVNSRAPTKTETEKEFQQSFVSMSSAILTSLMIVSYIITGIILLVLANTIVMAARERTTEYAVMKTLGFTGPHIAGLIAGESLLLACSAGVLGLLLTFPLANAFAKAFPTMFPMFNIEPLTILLAAAVAVGAGLIAAVFPAVHAVRMRIVDGLRSIG